MKITKFIPLILLLAFVGCQQSEPEAETVLNSDDYTNPQLLASAEWLNERLDDENVTIVDMRENPEDEFIPGAIYFGGVPELMDPDHPVASYLKGADDFADLMSDNGITRDETVVIYDEGKNLRSSRLFLALEYYGHPNVKLLNGGIEAWKVMDSEIASSSAEPEPAAFEVTMNETALCDIQTVLDAIDDDNTVIVDARPADQYSGETVNAQRGGHIPGAVNLYWEEMINQEGVPLFKTASEIRAIHEEYGITPDKRIITHCHSNMQASNAYFVLRLMGYENITSYEGSWSEYGNNPDVPVEL